MEANITDKPVTYNETNVQADFNYANDIIGVDFVLEDYMNKNFNDIYVFHAITGIKEQGYLQKGIVAWC